MRPSELLRLGCLMALTMTLHNLPEGFAVRPPCNPLLGFQAHSLKPLFVCVEARDVGGVLGVFPLYLPRTSNAAPLTAESVCV
jgi:zinc transporter ZupT